MSAPPAIPSPPGQAAHQRLLEHSLATFLAVGASDSSAVEPPSACDPPAYHPLVLCGPAGAGKSRYLKDVLLRCGAGRETPAALWEGPALDREILASLAAESLDRLHARFVSRRLILIDSIDAVSRPDAQQTLAHLFDAAVLAGTRFVVSLAVPPGASAALDVALATRLSGGLVIPLPGPSVGPPTAGDRQPAAGAGSRREAHAIRRVIAAAARHYGLAAADLTGPSRRRAAAMARSMAMYLSRHLTGQSLQRIGAAFGGRDHTTVMHSLRITERRIRMDPRVFHDAEELMRGLRDRWRLAGSGMAREPGS